ncbi:MAG: VIT1/CCC1 transporter family protein [Nanoarchaeota archaeon]
MASRFGSARNAYEKNDLELSRRAHTSGVIKKHVHPEEHGDEKSQYLGEFVYGAIDGAVTTFAVVAGATGAALSSGVVIILGFANLIADGFSMAVGNFISERTQRDFIRKERTREEWEVDHVPEGEREEIREIFRKKGFKGKELERVVEVITSDKKVWVDTMMVDELGLLESQKSPWKSAGATYFGFILIGLIPLLSYVVSAFFPLPNPFFIAIILTGIALFAVGAVKRFVTKTSLWKSAFETVFIGGAAAVIAYYVGFFLRWVVTVA